MQTSFLNNRNYIISIEVFRGVVISLISRIGAALTTLPEIISTLFISVQEQRRYHPSQGMFCQKEYLWKERYSLRQHLPFTNYVYPYFSPNNLLTHIPHIDGRNLAFVNCAFDIKCYKSKRCFF